MNSLSSEQDYFEGSQEESPQLRLFDLENQPPKLRKPFSKFQDSNLMDNFKTFETPYPDSPSPHSRNVRYHSFVDDQDELEIQHIPRTRTMDFKASLDPNLTTIWWILARLEEMGMKEDPYIVRRTIEGYPTGTAKEIILEAIIQNLFEEDIDEEPDAYSRQGFQFENRIIAARPAQYQRLLRINALLNNPALHDQVRDEAYCQFCYKLIHGNPAQYRVFHCTQVFCRDCLLANFKEKIDNGEDIEAFRCPDPDCNNRINIEKFVSLIPEVESRELGEEEIGTCNICFEPIQGIEEILKIFECQEHFFCYACTLNYLKEDINQRKVLNIKCPDLTCESILDDEKMKKLVPAYLFNKYARFKRNAMIERDPNIRWCTKPGCEKIVRGDKSDPKAVCECGQITCLNCGNPWHEKKTCEQALEEEYKMFAKQNDIQFCPECKSKVEKLAGCNHMTCPICTYEWCWLCGGEYSQGHFDPLNPLGCPGLMSGNHTRKEWNKYKILAYRFAIMLIFILLIALSPLWIVLGAILLPNLVYEPRYEHTRRKTILIRAVLFLIGVILMPLTIVCGIIGAIVPGTCFLASFLVKRHRERKQARIRRRELITTRSGRFPRDGPLDPDEFEHYNYEQNLRRDWNHNNILNRPLLFQEERFPQPIGDVSIDME